MRLKNKKIIVTGGSRGIGKAIAIGLAKEGADLVITYNNQKSLAEDVVKTINKNGEKSKSIQFDISNTNNFQCFIEEALDFLGEFHVLVNNIGVLTRALFLEIKEKELDEVMDTNFKGNFLLTQLISKQMKIQGKGGSIINISSLSDEIASEGLTHYQSSKAAVSMLTKGVALELSKFNIRVNTISPGLTKTDINKKQWSENTEIWKSRVSQIPLKRAGIPEDHVGAAVFLASDESSWITGTKIIIDGGRSLF